MAEHDLYYCQVNNGTEFEQLAREAIRNTAYSLLYKLLDQTQLGRLLSRITRQRVSRAIKNPVPNWPAGMTWAGSERRWR